ncbi:MAG: hypothetical protein RLZZ337_1901 [Bacteroidota bacterium]|jgi:hypothetical protein
MNNTHKLKTELASPISFEVFGVNGSTQIQGDQSILFAKLVTSCGKNTWNLMFQN